MPSIHTHLDSRSRTGRGAHPSLWLGVIVNITAASVWVRVPQLAQDDIQATNTIAGDLAPGDRVVVGLMEGRVDNIVVLAKEDPSIAAHVHLETDIRYPGWTTAPLLAPWTAVTGTDYFPGLRYRVDSRHIYVNGCITGGTGPSGVAWLPVTLAYASTLNALNSSGQAVQLTIDKSGNIYTYQADSLRINGSAPLT